MNDEINLVSLKKIIYTEKTALRIDKFLAEKLSLSRERIKKEIENENIKVNDKTIDPSLKLKTNDLITIKELTNKFETIIPAQKSGINILFEDKEIIVLNKPPHTITHPTTKILTGTLVNFILYHTELSSIGLPLRPGVVHRLDKDTSGTIMFAKTDFAYWNLINQFKERKVKKTYIAIVEGKFSPGTKEVSLPLNVSKKERTKRNVTFSGGKTSLTHLKLISTSGVYSIVEAHPVTGRTHQIRIILSFLGHPVVGDVKYGKASSLIERQALHAYSLSFYHPKTNEFLTFIAEIPDDIKQLLKKINIDADRLIQNLKTD